MTDPRALPARTALVVAAGAVLLGVAAWLILTVGSSGPRVGPGPGSFIVTLGPGMVAEQRFFMPSCDLDQFSIRLGAPAPQLGSLRASLHRVSPDDRLEGTPAFQGEADLRKAVGGVVRFEFPAIANGWRQRFLIRLEARNAPGGVPLMARSGSGYRFGGLSVDGWIREGTLVFSAGAAGESWSGYLGCAASEGMGPLASPFALPVLLLGFMIAVTLAVFVVGGPTRTSAQPHAASAVESRRRAMVVVPLGLFIAAALLWLLVTPPFEAPDELHHYDYARYIAATGTLPTAPDARFYSSLFFHPPLYYLVLNSLIPASAVGESIPYTGNPRFSWQRRDEAMLLLHSGPPTSAAAKTLFRLRTIGLMMGILTVCLLFALARDGPTGARAAVCACCCLVLVPQFTYFWAVVSNDTLATLLATASVCLMLRPRDRQPGIRRTFIVGLLIGAALSTKLSTVYLIPAAGAVVVLQHWRWPGRLLIRGLVLLGGVVGTGVWVFLRNWWTFGDPLATKYKMQFFTAPLVSRRLDDAFFLHVLPQELFRSFWASFGWMTVVPRGAWLWALYVAVTAMLVALAAVGALRVLRGRDDRQSRIDAGVALAGVVAGGVAFVEYSRTWPVSQARILYPLLAPLLVLVVGGARDTIRHVRGLVSGVEARWLAALFCLALAVAWMATFRHALLAFHYGF